MAADSARRPRVWTVFLALPMLMFVQGTAATPFTLIALARLDPSLWRPPFDVEAITAAFKAQAMSGWLLVASLALTGVVNVAFVAALAAASPEPWRRRIAFPSWRIAIGDGALALLAGFGASAMVTSTAQLLEAYDGSTVKLFAHNAASATPAMAVLLTLAGMATGGSEELLFRGYIQTRLAERYGAATAVVVASAFFGLWHFDLVQGLFAFLFGLLLGVIAVRRGTIATGIVVHVVNNAIAFGAPRFLDFGDASRETKLLSIAVGAAVFVAAGCALWFRTRSGRHQGARDNA